MLNFVENGGKDGGKAWKWKFNFVALRARLNPQNR